MTIITIIFRFSNLNSYRHSGHLSLPLYSHGVILRFSSSFSSALTSILPPRADYLKSYPCFCSQMSSRFFIAPLPKKCP